MTTTLYRLVTVLVWLVIVGVVGFIGANAWGFHKQDQAAHTLTLMRLVKDDYVAVVDNVAPYYSKYGKPWIYYQDRDTAAEIAELSKPLPDKYVEESHPEFHVRVRELIALAKNERWKQRVRPFFFVALGALTIGGIFQLLWRWIMNPMMKKVPANEYAPPRGPHL